MRILELGTYIAPAYAGMILAEQGNYVEKWFTSRDPIFDLKRSRDLWEWINHDKTLHEKKLEELEDALSSNTFHVVIDNIRLDTWLRILDTTPEQLAKKHDVVWISLRDELNERSFDAVTQARSWAVAGAKWVPFYVGDTTAGLWLAFSAYSKRAHFGSHYIVGHSTCMAKMIEGDQVVKVKRHRNQTPWDRETYLMSNHGEAYIEFKGESIHEPRRNRQWQLDNLFFDATGRSVVPIKSEES